MTSSFDTKSLLMTNLRSRILILRLVIPFHWTTSATTLKLRQLLLLTRRKLVSRGAMSSSDKNMITYSLS